MNKNKIVSAPIRIKLLDTSTIYEQEQTEYTQIMIEPSPSHYPQFIEPLQKQPLCTTSEAEVPVTASCFLFDIFCCGK